MAASHYVALVFGSLFLLAGLVKLLPLDADQIGHGLPAMNTDFERFITVLPFRDLLAIKTVAMYMSMIGVAEAVFGAVLAFGRPQCRIAAACPLLVIMVGAFYTLVMLGEPLQKTIPSIVFGSALVYILLNKQGLDASVTAKSKAN